ncbi:hypothetical protein Dpoa2040_001740 [Dickeya sp. CFBP 2040]|nr:hypothetical protein [Dickeya sp. CFBP 2040]
MTLRLVTVQNVNKITILIDFALYVTFYSQHLNQFLRIVHFWFNIFTFKEQQTNTASNTLAAQSEKSVVERILTPTGVEE